MRMPLMSIPSYQTHERDIQWKWHRNNDGDKGLYGPMSPSWPCFRVGQEVSDLAIIECKDGYFPNSAG